MWLLHKKNQKKVYIHIPVYILLLLKIYNNKYSFCKVFYKLTCDNEESKEITKMALKNKDGEISFFRLNN